MFRRIFLSAASSEFGDLRADLAFLLQRAGFNVEHQDIFPSTPCDTVRKLGQLITECPLVIHIAGQNPGSVAAPPAVEDLLHGVPPGRFLANYPDLLPLMGDFSGITYTQWEAFLALHYNISLLVYVPDECWDAAAKDWKPGFPQREHTDRLRKVRRYPEICSAKLLLGKILADVFRHFGISEEEQEKLIPRALPQRNPQFRGRRDDLVSLHGELEQAQTIGITQQVALFASGGVGKSSLALEFAWDAIGLQRAVFPGGAFWCDCRDRDPLSLAWSLAALAPALGLAQGSEKDPLPVARAVREKLSTGPPSLLILDNVLDAAQWRDGDWSALLPAGKCRRLVTTRAESLGDQRIRILPLATLSAADARELLRAYREDVPLAEQADAIQSIIHWFGGLAVGLTVVGIYLHHHSDLSWDAYWLSLQRKKLAAVRDTEDLAPAADYARRVDAVIDDLFHDLPQAEQQALLYTSVLPGDDVSDRWLMELLSADEAAGQISGKTPPGYESLAEASLRHLLRRRILVRAVDTDLRKTVFLHQVIRERCRELLSAYPPRLKHIAKQTQSLAEQNYMRSLQWRQAIEDSSTFAEAWNLLESMSKADCDPDEFTFTTLLNKTYTLAEGEAVLHRMKEAGVNPNEVTFNTLLKKAETLMEGEAVLVRMKEAGVNPDAVSFTTLLKKAETFAEGEAVLVRMKEAGVNPDPVTFTTLLKKAETYAQGVAVLGRTREAGLNSDEFTFTNVLKKAHSFAEGKIVLDCMKEAGAKVNEITLNILLNKADTFTESENVLVCMKEAGVKPNEFTFTTLLNKAATLAEGEAVLARMKEAGLKPDAVTFNSLLKKVGTLAEGEIVLDRMKEAGAKPDAFTFNTLLKKADTLQAGKTVLDRMKEAGVNPDAVSFNTLLNKTGTFVEGESVLDDMKEAGVIPNEVTFNTLLNKAGTFVEGETVLGRMKEAGVKPDAFTFNTLLNKADTLVEGETVLGRMKEIGVKPDGFTFNTLMKKIATFVDGETLLARMKEAGVKPDELTFTSLLKKAGTFERVVSILSSMKQHHIRPSGVTLGTLTGRVQNLLAAVEEYGEAQEVIEKMLFAGLRSTGLMFGRLFSIGAGMPPLSDILEWYWTLDYHPLQALGQLLQTLVKWGRMEEAWSLALRYPLLTECRELIKARPDEGRAVFDAAKAADPAHRTADLAVGVLALETGEPVLARARLKKALKVTSNPEMRSKIEKLLRAVPGT